MTTPGIAVEISVPHTMWKTVNFDPRAIARKAVDATLSRVEIPSDIADKTLEISLVLSGDKEVQVLNWQYRGKDNPTNVLSFTALDDEGAQAELAAGGPFCLGDIILAYETIEREATELGKSMRDHYIHLVVHGFLHLLGYDHLEEKEAQKMEGLEVLVLADLGIENPYENHYVMQE